MNAVATATIIENPISRYLLDGYSTIQGWLMEGARDLTLALGEVQRTAGVAPGPILEIGVWKARYLCLLSFVPAEPTPVIAPLMVCVVDTGMPRVVAMNSVTDPASSAPTSPA